MPDWSKSMKQRYEYYVVDPETWGDAVPLDCVTACTIMRDAEAETLGSASFNVTKDLAEQYVRAYLITVQNGVTERFCLGTFLASAPSYGYNGTTKDMKMDGYTPLIELKENQPPLGYSLMKEENIMAMASALADENMRGPVVSIDGDGRKTLYDNFVANTDDTWLSFIKDLILMDDHKFALDDYSRVLFDPVVPLDKMQPFYTYNTDNSSILYPDLTIERDFMVYQMLLKYTHKLKMAPLVQELRTHLRLVRCPFRTEDEKLYNVMLIRNYLVHPLKTH